MVSKAERDSDKLIMLKAWVLLEQHRKTTDVDERIQCHLEARELLYERIGAFRDTWRAQQEEEIRSALQSLVLAEGEEEPESWSDKVAEIIDRVMEILDAIREVFPDE